MIDDTSRYSFSTFCHYTWLIHFFSEIGIINELQKDMFAKVFNLNKRYKASFGFVIDVTGSMSNNIAQVTSASVDIITNVLNTENEPEDYVLTTFSDPRKCDIFKTFLSVLC